MSPRPYRLGQRQASVEATRARILAAARNLLAGDADISAFTVDMVAHHAGVARMTVYYQFDSKRGLLEALSDMLATRGLVGPLRDAFTRPDPVEQLDGVVNAFCGFWASDRVVIRRLHSLAALDREIGQSIHARDRRRRDLLRTICDRLAAAGRAPAPGDAELDILHTLTSFEVYDMLAGMSRSEAETAQIVARLVRHELCVAAASAAPPATRPRRRSSRRSGRTRCR
jgi:AcrR family transcriptional regulator